MQNLKSDILIIGAGFAGSLCALLAQRIGKKTVLVERGTHPRFSIGESSTPMADLVLKNLTQQYDLPRLRPFCNYGNWCRTYPDVNRGLKRGFSYFHHQTGERFTPTKDHSNELLVTANPDNERADTHWFRADFDHFLVGEVQAANIPYFDQSTIEKITPGETWQLEIQRQDDTVNITADFVIDASGPAGVLAKVFCIENDLRSMKTNSRTIYSHFTGVQKWHDIYSSSGGNTQDHPFECDAAALHHIFDGGWMWVLHFDNDITSAGFVLDCNSHPLDYSLSPQDEWATLMQRYPSIQQQFENAKMIQPFCRTGRIQRRLSCIAGSIENHQPANWAMLPYTACFIDPLHSMGNAHTLFGIERLFRILSSDQHHDQRSASLKNYEHTVYQEVEMMDTIIHGCYAVFNHFELMTAFSMLYFAGAIHCEHRRMHNLQQPQDAFINSHDERFRNAVMKSYETLIQLTQQSSVSSNQVRNFQEKVAELIEPYNIAGLCDPNKNNMYPYI